MVADGSASMEHPARIEMCQRPAASRDTVTVDGPAPSGSGRDQRMSSGAGIFASQTCPSRYRDPEAVNVADARDLRLDLIPGTWRVWPRS